MSKYFSCADTAKLIRQSLKEAFPGIKFTVHSHTYSGGASINVSWIDGPNEAQVNAVAGTFSDGYFDGMTDFKGRTYAMIDGEQVRFGADFVFCNRRYSRMLCDKIATRAHYAGTEVKGSDALGYWLYNHDESAAHWLNHALRKHSDRLQVEKSKTACKVIYLGNDGYSDVGALSV